MLVVTYRGIRQENTVIGEIPVRQERVMGPEPLEHDIALAEMSMCRWLEKRRLKCSPFERRRRLDFLMRKIVLKVYSIANTFFIANRNIQPLKCLIRVVVDTMGRTARTQNHRSGGKLSRTPVDRELSGPVENIVHLLHMAVDMFSYPRLRWYLGTMYKQEV